MILRNFVLLPIFVAGIIIFALPIYFRIFNVGNFVGITFFSVATLVTIFWNKITPLLEIKFFRITASIILGIVAVLLVIFVVVSAFMIAEIRNSPPENSTLIVLGCKVKGETPSLMLEKRLLAALDYLEKNENTFCVVSGGQGADEAISEALAMQRFLVQNGISSGRIILEDKSTSTFENLSFSLKLLEKNGLDKGNLTIVSSEFHLLRASVIAKKLGLETTSLPAKTSWYLFPTYWLRDAMGNVYEFIF